MRPAYTIKAQTGYEDNPQAEGFVQRDHIEVDYDLALYCEQVAEFPEFSPARVYRDLYGPLVLQLGERRFKVQVEQDADYDGGVPEPGWVSFEETEEPETPFEQWDARHAAERHLQYLQGNRPGAHNDRERYQTEQCLLAGDLHRFQAPAYGHVFGQPTFLQHRWHMSLNGKACYNLFTLETGWGDCGNENYMVALDDEGYPVAVFHEASCC